MNESDFAPGVVYTLMREDPSAGFCEGERVEFVRIAEEYDGVGLFKSLGDDCFEQLVGLEYFSPEYKKEESMTPCEERGFGEGMVLEVIEDIGFLKSGEYVTLSVDESDSAPPIVINSDGMGSYVSVDNLRKPVGFPKEKTESENDMVNNPSHYQLLPGVEVKDVREAILNNIDYDVPYIQIDMYSRSWEYLTRMWGKNGLEDAKKARVYLDWLIEKMEESEES